MQAPSASAVRTVRTEERIQISRARASLKRTRKVGADEMGVGPKGRVQIRSTQNPQEWKLGFFALPCPHPHGSFLLFASCGSTAPGRNPTAVSQTPHSLVLKMSCKSQILQTLFLPQHPPLNSERVRLGMRSGSIIMRRCEQGPAEPKAGNALLALYLGELAPEP